MPQYNVAAPKLDKLKPLDYGLMIGLPVIFVAFAFFGLRWFAAPPIPQPSVERLRSGAVHSGMTAEEVLHLAGEPKSVTTNEDGRTTFRYMNSAWDSARSTFVEEDAYVDFDPSGRVTNLSFETQTPAPPK